MNSRLRPYIVGTLWAGGLLLFVLLIAVVLWSVLGAVGDRAGADMARILALLVAVCWALDSWALLVLVALGLLSTGERMPPMDEES